MPTHNAYPSSLWDSSIGVVIHFDYDTPATWYINALKELRINQVRTGPPDNTLRPVYAQLGVLGVEYMMFECNVYMQNNNVNAANDVVLCHNLLAEAPNCIRGIEGCNEYDGWHFKLDGKDSYKNMPWGMDDAKQLEHYVHADSLMNGVLVVAPSALDQANTPQYGAVVDCTNAHCYSPTGEQLQTWIQNGINYVRATNPGKPVYMTETGVSTGGYDSGQWSGGDEPAQAIMVMNAALTGFANGVACTYIYELRNWLNNGNGNANQDNFGLYDTGGNAKEAADMLRNLRLIMADSVEVTVFGGGKCCCECPPTEPPVEPPIDPEEPPIDPEEPPVDSGGGNELPVGSLELDLSGMPGTGAFILLQKSNGTMQVVLWNPGAKISDGRSTVMPPETEVTVTFGQMWVDLAVYDPSQSSEPVDEFVEADTVTVSLGAYPIIIEIPA
jgi:hypothetical protein